MEITITLPDVLTFTSGDDTYTVPTVDIHVTSFVRLLMYGHRAFNDSVNGSIHAEKGKPTGEQRGRKVFASDWIDAFKSGTLGTGRGGASRLSDLEKELRAIIHKQLVNFCGYKSGDATKIVSKGSHVAFAVVVKDLGATDEKAESGWAAMIAKAKATIAERASGPDISALFADDEPETESDEAEI